MKYFFALLISLSPTPAYFGICNFIGENLIVLVLLQLLSGVFVRMMIKNFHWAVIIISAVIISMIVAVLSYSKDALWVIGYTIAFILTLIQFVTVNIGISMKEKYTRKMEPANPLLKG